MYEISYHSKPTYLHAIITGDCNKVNVLGFLEEVVSKCFELNHKKVLFEERLIGPRIETEDVYRIVSGMCAKVDGFFEAVAFVDTEAESVINTKFAESIADRRGIPLRVFFKVEDAKKWLNSKK